MDSICFVLGVLVSIVAIAIVGHALWLMFAALYRAVRGEQAPNSPLKGSKKQPADPRQQITQDLQAAQRLIEYARFKHWLHPDQVASLNRLISEYTSRTIEAPPDTQMVEPPRQSPPAGTIQKPFSSDFAPPVHPLDEPEPLSAMPEVHDATAAVTAPGVADILAQKREQTSELPSQAAAIGPSLPDRAQAPKPPRGAVMSASIMRAFMERTNIRWIELISASLIVVCSVGLVISLWSTLSSTSRYFPSLIFLLATVAVHAAGQYTLRQWNLRSTSRSILHIGLMLIPLAVLVGILLSARQGASVQFDAMTLVALAIGTLVYGFAAVTASRTLFASRWLLVAASVIVGSLTLVPIHYLHAHQQLSSPMAAFTLAPLVAIGLMNALQLSQFEQRRSARRAGRSRRIVTQVLQVLFAAFVPLVFWIARSGGLSTLSDSAIALAGMSLAGWASWGWSASNLRRHNIFRSTGMGTSRSVVTGQGQRPGWYVVIAWGLAAVCSLGLLAVLWQTSGHRGVFAGFLLALCVWWFTHGLRCGLAISLLAGSVAGILSLGLFGEWTLPDSQTQIQTRDWLLLSRVASIDAVSVLFGLLGYLLSLNQWSGAKRDSRLRPIASSLIAASGLTLLGTAALATIACLVPWSEPAYGGNWAPLLVTTIGALIMGGGIVASIESVFGRREPHDSIQSVRRIPKYGEAGITAALVPIGQIVMLFGAVRLCQTAPMMPSWIEPLRPWRAWAVGGGSMALLWAATAAGLRAWSVKKTTQPSDAQFNVLVAFATVVAGFAALTYWTTIDRFALASSMGWVLPATLLLSYVAIRHSAWRESALLAFAAWIVTVLIRFGWTRGWWESLGLTATCGLLSLAVLAVILADELLSRRKLKSDAAPLHDDRWASNILSSVNWIVVLASLLLTASLQLWQSLSHASSIDATNSFVLAPTTLARASLIGFVLAALSAVTFWLKSDGASVQRLWLATIPVAAALLAGCLTPAPHSVSVVFWVLAGVFVALEVLSLTKSRWGGKLESVRRAWVSGKGIAKADQWLGLTKGLGLGSLAAGSLLMTMLMGLDGLPKTIVPLESNTDSWSGWFDNLSRVARWLAPLAIVLAVRWFSGMWSGLPARWITDHGYGLGLVLAILLAIVSAQSTLPMSRIAIQGFTLILGLISVSTLGFTTGRNWLGLRQLDRKSTAWQLFSKASGGARWREADKASGNLWLGAIWGSAILSAVAAVYVASCPVGPIAVFENSGNWWVLAGVALALAIWWSMASRRGISKFGLIAMTLGLIAPVVSAQYASYLLKHSASGTLVGVGFHPYRLLIGLWLVSLAFGLGLRVYAGMSRAKLSNQSEAMWIVLASLVGGLAFYGLDRDSYWAFAQLCILAVLIALSSEASRQVWRGWIAAIVGMIAWSPWVSAGSWSTSVHFLWQALWGATGVGLVAILSRWAFESLGTFPMQNDSQSRSPADAGLAATVQQNSAPLALSQRNFFTIDRLACAVVSALSIILSGLWVMRQPSPVSAPTYATWTVAALVIANLTLAILRLWDRGPSHRGLGMYLATIASSVSLVGVASSIATFTRFNTQLGWLCGFLGALALLAVLLREIVLQRIPAKWLAQWDDLLTPDKLAEASRWMAGWHTLAALVCLVPSVVLVFTMPEAVQRMAAIALPMLGAASIWPVAADKQRSFQRGSVLILVSATLVLAWWADLPAAWTMRQDQQSWRFAHRAFLALTVLSWLYPILAWRRSGDDPWSRTLTTGGWICLGLAGLVGSGLVGGTFTEFWGDLSSIVPLPVKLAMLAGWAAIFARLIQFAARPSASERSAPAEWRTAAVYFGEVTLALAGAAVLQFFPELFSGTFRPWWPIIVLALAFLSIGIGELLRKANQPILADPIHRSSLLLPLIPLAGVWWLSADSPAASWSDWGRYALLLLTSSTIYGLYGWTRNSIVARTVSALTALLSFWAFLLSHPNMRFFEHPQFWLLPPAIGILGFVEWNRKRLDSTTVTVTRYLCILVAYLSSTVEVFFRSMEGHLWQPLLLLILSLCGVAAAIVLRVRAFLYCGCVFIAVALVGMVRHASQSIDQVWPWWAFGIATGVGLIVLLGYLEKNRPRVMKYLADLKQWQS